MQTQTYHITLERNGDRRYIVLCNKPTTPKMKWGSGPMWTIISIEPIKLEVI